MSELKIFDVYVSKVYEARQKLQANCGFERHSMTGSDFVKYLIKLADPNLENNSILIELTKSLLLVAR